MERTRNYYIIRVKVAHMWLKFVLGDKIKISIKFERKISKCSLIHLLLATQILLAPHIILKLTKCDFMQYTLRLFIYNRLALNTSFSPSLTNSYENNQIFCLSLKVLSIISDGCLSSDLSCVKWELKIC